MAVTSLPRIERSQQGFRAAKQIALRGATGNTTGIARDKPPVAMIARHLSPKILDTNLQPPAASRTILDKIYGAGHGGISLHQNCHPANRSASIDYRKLGWSYVNNNSFRARKSAENYMRDSVEWKSLVRNTDNVEENPYEVGNNCCGRHVLWLSRQIITCAV